MPRHALHALLLLLLALVSVTPVHADGWTAADTEAAMAEHSWLAGCIVEIETGHTLDPYSVGRQGELGVAQLHPQGLLPEFYAVGYTDPFSPYQALDFLDEALERGEGRAWAGYWYCI